MMEYRWVKIDGVWYPAVLYTETNSYWVASFDRVFIKEEFEEVDTLYRWE